MNRRSSNVAELWCRFDASGFAADALQEVWSQNTSNQAWDLEELLRYHAEEGVYEEDEISMRDAFDHLLAFYSCIEIASMVGFVPDSLPRGIRDDVAETLCNRYVRRYYRRHYPLLLPDLLCARIAGVRSRNERLRKGATPLFLEFLHISGVLENDPDVSMLLWFLDDGCERGYSWRDTLKILRQPEDLVRALKRRSERRNPAQQATDGLRKFLGFCVALDELLRRSRNFPLFQAAIWHYHSYWFRTIRGDVRIAIEDCITSFQGWSLLPSARSLSPKETTCLRAESTASIQEIRQIMKRLTGGGYGRILTRHERQIRRDSARSAEILKTGLNRRTHKRSLVWLGAGGPD